MQREDLLKIIEGKDYNCLREDESLKRSILLVPGGSIAYGTNIDTPEHVSDVDIRGVYAHTKVEILKMKYDEKPYENHEEPLDLVVYPVKQMMKLMASCNPNVAEIFGVREDYILHCSRAGKFILENKDIFVSKRAFYTFGGMASHNLQLAECIIKGKDMSKNKITEYTAKSMERVINNLKNKFGSLQNSNFTVYVDDSEKYNGETEIFMDLNLSHMPFEEMQSMMSELGNVVKDYRKQDHKKRNRKKTEADMFKHLMHTIRVLTMGIEILETGEINTYRYKDREFLLDIRNMKYSLDDIFEMAADLDKKLNYAMKNTSLQDDCDMDKVDELTAEISRMVLEDNF